MPKVSVLMSAYNVEEYIEKAVESILAQTWTDLELFVVDDGSSDSTFSRVSALSDPRLHLSRQENRGKSPTLNSLLERAAGQYIAIQDSDDVSEPTRLELQVKQFEADPSLGVVMCGHSLIIDGKVVAPRARFLSKEQCREEIGAYRMPAHDPTMMFRADLARKIRFDEELYLGEGLDFILQMGELSEILVIGEALYQYRIHSASITKRASESKARQLMTVINKARVRRGLDLWSYDEFDAEYGPYIRDKDNNLSGHFTDSAYQSVISGRRREAFSTAISAIAYVGKSKSYLKPLVYALSPKRVVVEARARLGSGK